MSDIFDYSHIPVSVLMTKIIVIKYLITCLAKIGPKIKSGQNLLKFSTFKISNMSIWILTSKSFLWNIYGLLGPIWSQNLKCSGFIEICTFDISNILISILMSKIIFIKYLPLLWPKLVPKLKVLRVYWNLVYLIFQISWSRFWCQRLFSLNTYHFFGPNWSQN